MARGPYKDFKYEDFAGGLNTRIADHKLESNESPDMQNVTFDGKGSIIPRYGNKIFGATTSATGEIRNTWVTQTDAGVEIPIRVVDDGTNEFMEYYNSQTLAWENLDADYTQGYDFGHAEYDFYTYWSSKADYQRRWNGIQYATSTYCDSAYSRVDLPSTVSALGFLSAGSVVIGGEEVYYSSISSKALSGITFTQAHNGGVAVAQLPTSAGEAPAVDGGWVSSSNNWLRGDIMFNNDAQMFIAGASGVSGNVVARSAVDSPTNYAISAIPGGGGRTRFPESLGSITAMHDFVEVLTVMKADTIRQLEFIELADGGAGQLEIVERKAIVTSPKIGAINNKSVSKVENNLTYVSKGNWVKHLTYTRDGKKSREISGKIRPTVEGYNMTSSSGRYFDGKYYLACATTNSGFNNIVLVYDYEYEAWTKFIGWNVADWYIYNNTLYYGASNEIATYQALVNYDDNSHAYNAYWSSKNFDFGIPQEQKRLREIYVGGYITTNATVGVSAYFDNDSAAPVPKSIVGTGDYVSTTDNITVIGGVVWGSGTYGGEVGTSEYNLKRFRVNLMYDADKPFYNLQIKVGTASPGYVWKIDEIAAYVLAIPGKRVPTNQQL